MVARGSGIINDELTGLLDRIKYSSKEQNPTKKKDKIYKCIIDIFKDRGVELIGL